MIEKAAGFVGARFGFAGRLLTRRLESRLGLDLYQAQLSVKPRAYFSACIGFASICAAFSVLTAPLLAEWPVLSFAVFSAALSLFLLYPSARKRKRALGVESSLADSLRIMSSMVALGLPFEECLRMAASGSACGSEFHAIIRRIEAGASVPEALAEASKSVDSSMFGHAMSQLSNAYRKSGRMSTTLSKAAEGAQSVVHHRLKEFGGKLVFYSLMFIGASAIVPSMLLSFSVVSSSFLEPVFSPTQLVLLSAVVFPLIDVALLAFIRSKSP
ncbi:type II secretion system F family protein [Candidatus Micrarchaeota archaeon]|nr:type II secretion system F family protein [Candidatus Micrarchaeota archaeon]